MLKPYFLTTKSNLMTKFKMNGKSMLMVLSFFAFMILGSVSVSAQNWVPTSEAVVLLKNKLTTLETEFNQAPTAEQKVEVAFKTRYYRTVFYLITDGGQEVGVAVESARPANKPGLHSSGMIAFSKVHPNFKNDVQALVDAGTDLLSN
jgi:hypothetical protein